MMQSEWDGTPWAGEPMKSLSLPDESTSQLLTRMAGVPAIAAMRAGRYIRPYRLPSVYQALGVPAIQRAVSLIASTTGMLSVQGFRNGAVMDSPPSIVVRPDPYRTPYEFYAGTAAEMAKFGEFIWWIAARDADGLAMSLVNVPVHEVKVDENKNDRLMPRYTWGSKTGTRYSGANRTGDFVHARYPTCNPLSLRGEGPLQLCRAAASVSVEAQEWAANFYAGGGNPSIVIKHAGELSPERLDPDTFLPDDDNGLNEAERLRAEFMNKPHNTPRVIDQNIESIDYHDPNPQGAQMLDARLRQDGESARMFGIPGSLLEFQQAGSSLTYQNLEGEFTKLVRICLQPLYLEPIEQALSDLLPRNTTARFNVKGFLRADIKTRFEVHQIAIDSGIYDPEYAQREEGILPGDVEFAPAPFAPPAAIPAPIAIPKAASLPMRDIRCPNCHRLLGKAAGSAELPCRHCKTLVAA